jgi:phenylacetate-CoA ligase
MAVMSPYASLIRNVFYPLWLWKNGSHVMRHLREFERTQFLDPEQIENLQLRRLKLLLAHAHENCPFYREHWQKAGVHPEDLKQLADLAHFPPVTKSEIQANVESMISRTASRGSLIKDSTGGSTGSPLVFYYDRERRDSRAASRIRHNRWAGWDMGTKLARLWAPDLNAPPPGPGGKFRRLVLKRAIMLDATGVTEESLREFVDKLNRYKPTVIQAYANMANLVATYVEKHGLEIASPRAMVTSAEVLTEEKRERIERVFGCPIFNRYGSREVALIASECAEHRGLHVNAESLCVEVIKDGRPAAPGELGEVLITDLLNHSMPLIRYAIGDAARRSTSERCACGRGLPMLQDIAGRDTDFLVTADGRLVSGITLATYMITNIKGVRQIQFVQERRDLTRIRLATNPGYDTDSETELLRRAEEFLGPEMRIELIPEENIPGEASGKFLFTVSKVAPFQ